MLGVYVRIDLSSTPNRGTLDNDKDVEGDEEQELMTPDSRGKRKGSPGASEETYQAKKSPRVLPTRSKIWNHITRTKENRDKFLCHYCKKEFCCSTKSGTSNLLKHFTICKHFMAITEGQSLTQTNINEEGKLKSGKVSATTFREATNEMMVIGQLPLCFIESVAWKHFCNKMDLDKLVSRRTLTRDIVEGIRRSYVR
ncbi:hypothetical protein N665_0066s0023 [Sinapis alba]|nr:hypothetical protein N665_0066s0023 [Sinapis alba]